MTRFKALSLLCAAAILLTSAHNASADDHFWSHHVGGPNSDYPWDIAANAAGSTAIAGYFFGTWIVDGDTLSSVGGSDIIVSKYTTGGTHVWSKALGGTGSDAALGVCVDDNGAVIVTGNFQETVDFGGGPLTSSGSDMFIVKYSALGDHVWSMHFGNAGGAAGADIAVNSAGTVAVTGATIGDIDFGGGTRTGIGGADSFIAVFSADGNHVWSNIYGSTATDSGWRVDMDDAGVVALAGYFMDSANLGGGAMTSAGGDDVYLAKYDAVGNHVWSNRYGAGGNDRPQGLAFDSAGQPAFTGTFRDTVDFGGGDLISTNSSDIVLAKYDTGGNHLWSQRFGGTGADKVYGLDIDALDQIVIVGGFPNTIDFGGGGHNSLGFDDVFVARFDNTGAWVWSERFGDSGDDKARSVAIDGYENIAIAGTFETSIDFGGGTLTNPTIFNLDGFIAKFRPSATTGIAGNTPTSPVLHQNYPNPFNPTTRISFSMLEESQVVLRVYDVQGRLVRTLLDRSQPEGVNAVTWDGRDDSGTPVGSGVYFYRLDAGAQSLTRKMVLLK